MVFTHNDDKQHHTMQKQDEITRKNQPQNKPALILKTNYR